MALSERQRKARMKGIGGSDAGPILGVSPYKSAVDVYLEKLGMSDEEPDNRAIHWGNKLERVVAKEYSERTGHKLTKPRVMISEEYPWMRVNLDFMAHTIKDEKRIVEVKTANQYMADKWGEEGTDQVPDEYLVQGVHGMIVAKVYICDIPVLIGGQDFRTYTVEYDKELAQMVIDREHDFWHNHVKAKIPPPPQSGKDVETLFAIDNGLAILADDDQVKMAHELRDLKDTIKGLTEKQDEMKDAFKLMLGENTTLVNDDGKALITWKKAKDGLRFNKTRLQEEMPEIYEKFMDMTQGSRRFLVK